MPFKSQRQITWARKQVSEGKMTQAQFDEWMAATPEAHKLPKNVMDTKAPRLRIAKTAKVLK